MLFRIDLEGGSSDGDGERIGIAFTGEEVARENDAMYVSLDPEDALELAAAISDAYALHRRWLDARDRDPDAPKPNPHELNGLTVESYRLHILLESGYDLEVAEKLAKDGGVDLHKAAKLAKDAGPKLAGEILT